MNRAGERGGGLDTDAIIAVLQRLSSASGVNIEPLCSSFQSLDQLGHLGDMRVESAEIFFQSFLQEALVKPLLNWAN